MSTCSLPTPVLSCPNCSRQCFGTILRSHKFILSGSCRCDTSELTKFYKCIVCPPLKNSIGFSRHFPSNHKRTQNHHDYSKLFMAPTIHYTQQLMDITVIDDIDINVDNNDTSLFSGGNTNDDMEIGVLTESMMEPQVTFPEAFLSKEHLDNFLRARIPKPSILRIISSYEKEHQDYYQAVCDGKGPNYVADYSLTKQLNTYLSRSDSDALFVLLFSKLSTKLSREDIGVLTSIIQHGIFDKNVYIPETTADVRTKLLEGKHSLQNTIPYPKSIQVGGGYAVLPLENIIRHLFSTDNPPYPFFEFPDSIHAKTPRGQEFLNHVDDISVSPNTVFYPIQIGLWSDAFLPHNFSDKSVHCCVVTIGAREGDHSGRFSFPYWLGPAKNSTDEVEQYLVNELNLLSKGRTKEGPFLVYHKRLDRFVQVKTCPFSFLCDRPDKAKRTGTLLGGTYGLLYGHVGKFSQIIDKVVCCARCYIKLLRKESVGSDAVTKCNNCYSFDLSLMEYAAADNYPTDQLLDSSIRILKVKKITFATLKAACRVGFTGISKSGWSKDTLTEYLKSEGINHALIGIIYDNAMLQKIYISIDSSNCKLATKQVEAYRKQMKVNPDTYPIDNLPKCWGLENMDICDFVGGPGHQIFLGIMKSLCHLMKRYLQSQQKLYSFRDKFDVKLMALSNLKLAYAQISNRSGAVSDPLTFGGWLSRHYLTLSRFCKWLFCHIHLSATKKSPSLPTHNNYHEYSSKEMMSWLRERGICTRSLPVQPEKRYTWFDNLIKNPELMFQDYSKDKILEFMENNYPDDYDHMSSFLDQESLKEEFTKYVRENGIIPPVTTTNKTMKKNDDDMKEVFGLFHCVVSRLMGPEGDQPEEIGRYIKLFLTKVHLVDMQLIAHLQNNLSSEDSINPKKNKKNPVLSKKLNFLTMLNIPDEIKRFNHLRFMWELGGMGEGYIPLIKKEIYDLRENFASNAINAVMRKVSYSDLFGSLLHTMSNNINNTTPVSVAHMMEAADGYKMKVTETNGLSNACHKIAGQLLGHGNKFVDSENNSIEQHRAIEDHPLHKSHNQLAIPIVVRLSTGVPYMLLNTKVDQCLIPLNFNYKKYEYLFDAWYFRFPGFDEAFPSIRCSEIYQKDLICSLLLQHPIFKTYYYCVRMDWKEYGPNIDTNYFGFGNPVIRDECRKRVGM